jgi:hypothetical protein
MATRTPNASEILNPAQTLRRRMADAEDEALGSKSAGKPDDETPKNGPKTMTQAEFTAPPGKRRADKSDDDESKPGRTHVITIK